MLEINTLGIATHYLLLLAPFSLQSVSEAQHNPRTNRRLRPYEDSKLEVIASGKSCLLETFICGASSTGTRPALVHPRILQRRGSVCRAPRYALSSCTTSSA